MDCVGEVVEEDEGSGCIMLPCCLSDLLGIHQWLIMEMIFVMCTFIPPLSILSRVSLIWLLWSLVIRILFV